MNKAFIWNLLTMLLKGLAFLSKHSKDLFTSCALFHPNPNNLSKWKLTLPQRWCVQLCLNTKQSLVFMLEIIMQKVLNGG